jgi:casein kinase I family protein HRR25
VGARLFFIVSHSPSGDIYLGINFISGEKVAIKLTSVQAKHPQLEYESNIRRFGTKCDSNVMVLALL